MNTAAIACAVIGFAFGVIVGRVSKAGYAVVVMREPTAKELEIERKANEELKR